MAHTTDKKVINQALDLYLNAAKDVEFNAGYSGSLSDGGASSMRSLVQAYKDGMNGVTPAWLKSYVTTIEREADPEYANYLRLKTKFKE